MNRSHHFRTACACLCLTALLLTAPSALAQKPFRITPYGEREFNQGILWGSEAASPDGFTLAFGGQDLDSEDGIGHTRIREKKDGEWQPLHETLQKANPLQRQHDALQRLFSAHQRSTNRLRTAYLEGIPPRPREKDDAVAKAKSESDAIVAGIAPIFAAAEEISSRDGELRSRCTFAAGLRDAYETGNRLLWIKLVAKDLDGEALSEFDSLAASLEKAANLFAAEPPPRAISPIVFEPKSGLFFVFGGDQFDCLMNDTWSFDPKARKWSVHRQEKAPAPRAGHTLKAAGDGKIVLSGGYTYSSNTDYCGSQYQTLDDGEWVYDVEKNAWSGGKEGVEMIASGERVYRTGPFHPDFYLEPAPDRKANEKTLAAIEPNRWVKMNPPKLPELNRDWGTAIYDPQRDLILRFSGGHSAHGGSDVLHYHLATNRWELCFPVEFPLGQLYSNTSYPEGFNFNGRPWVTGHTYKSYGYEPQSDKMLFLGHTRHTYYYDPAAGDWEPYRQRKPRGMDYDGSFYTLTLCPTEHTLYCWTQYGELFEYVAEPQADDDKSAAHRPSGWQKVALHGDKLPGSVVDHSGMTYDSKRGRLLCCRNPYGGKHTYDGQIHAIDLESGEVSALSPAGAGGMAQVRFLRELVYDPRHDLMVVGALLPADGDGLRRTPAYDCEDNRWVSLKLGGDHPHGKEGRNVSLGMIYDPKRALFWAVDTHSQVYALRLDPQRADLKPLE